jgi:hypothetical protein
MIPRTFNPRDFTERLISAVNIAMANREDIDQWSDERKASTTILNLSCLMVPSSLNIWKREESL